MITNLLDYARVEAGTLELSIIDIEMVRMIRSVVAGARADAAAEIDFEKFFRTAATNSARLTEAILGQLAQGTAH